jgi:hypothetical protein
MDYWSGSMNWPIEADWACEICNTPVSDKPGGFVSAVFGGPLQWGFVFGECRCTNCHAPYRMLDYSQPTPAEVTRPIPGLKPEATEPARKLWQTLHKPIDEATLEEWIEAGLPPPNE